MQSFVISVRGAKRLLRLGILASAAALTLSACTTVEGTNALTDAATFEREVLRSTLQGVGMVPKEERQRISAERGPLVEPTSGSTPPPPQQSTAQIPQDSSSVVLDTQGLTTADLEALRTGRVIDSSSVAGRPLTDAEARQLAARMQAYRRAQGLERRNIYLPPEEYFQRVGGQDLICLASNGDLVTVDDPRCPADVRAALANR